MNIDDVVKQALESHCKEKGHSAKVTKLVLDLAKLYRTSGKASDADLQSFLDRIQKELKKEEGG
jgi:DNA-binding TFAR19-related protein (PDSD5 family)